jgi:hypothetical protein
MEEFMEEKLIIADKIEVLTKSLAHSGKEDAYIIANTIRRLKHKLNELNGISNDCDIQDGECLSCGA